MAQMKIHGATQIMDSTIENNNILDSTIALAKLADGTELVKRDGSVAFTGDLDLGNHILTNVADGVAATDGVSKWQLDTEISNVNTSISDLDNATLKKADNLSDLSDVAAARTNLDVYSQAEVDAKVTGSLTYMGLFDAANETAFPSDVSKWDFYKVSSNWTVDWVELAVGDMIIANKDVTWASAAADWDKVDNTESADLLRTWDVSTDADFTVDGTKLTDRATIKTYVENQIGTTLPTDVYGENLTVTDGSATVSDLANAPTANADVRVYLNGLRMREWTWNDYTISGQTITFEYTLHDSLFRHDVVVVDYKY